jgi:tRNA A-37 threonylcarbamoyl transferase component Bud32
MVVMRYVRGEMIDKKYQSGGVPESMRKTVHEAVKFLHQKQFVHGDV